MFAPAVCQFPLAPSRLGLLRLSRAAAASVGPSARALILRHQPPRQLRCIAHQAQAARTWESCWRHDVKSSLRQHCHAASIPSYRPPRPPTILASATYFPAHEILQAPFGRRLLQEQRKWFTAARIRHRQYVSYSIDPYGRRHPVVIEYDDNGNGNGNGNHNQPSESRAWIYGCIAFGVGFYLWNLETVPMTGRRRFNVISRSFEKTLGDWQFEETMSELRGRILPSSHPWVIHAKHVTARILAAHADEPDMQGTEWQVFVIDAPNEFNAFVLPGGQIFIYTGILRICRDEEGLATVLGHEIAHVRAHHLAERTSQNLLTILGSVMAYVLLGILGSGFTTWNHLETVLPHSRIQEEEADRIGLQMLAQSCYEPAAATELWRRMDAAEQVKVPELLSTHPTSRKRMENLTKWQADAEKIYVEKNCGPTYRQFRGFSDFWRYF